MNNDDAELIEKLLVGDRQAGALFENGDYAKLINWAMRHPFKSKSGSKELKVYDVKLSQEEMIELHRDILCKILEKLKSFSGSNGCSLKTWVRTIAGNKTIDYLRKRKRERKRPTVSLDDNREDEDGHLYSDPSVDDATENTFRQGQEVQFRKDELKVLLESLDGAERQFAEASFGPDEKPEDIAANLGITVKNYYVRKMRLRQKLGEMAREKKIR